MNIIALFGKPGSGKDTIAKALCEDFRYEKAVMCTTRPIRDGEIDGIDYYFLEDDVYRAKQSCGSFIYDGAFRCWNYGLSAYEVESKENVVIVANPNMFDCLKDKYPDIITFYIDGGEVESIFRQLHRGDELSEVERRYYKDLGKHAWVCTQCDFVVNNMDSVDDSVDEILFDIAFKKDPKNLEKFVMEFGNNEYDV